MVELFDSFPQLKNDKITIKKMTESDVEALVEISNSDNVYKYIAPFLFKKSDNFLLTAIKNLGGRDFEKKKMIIAGIYLNDNPNRLVGLSEMFDYKKRINTITIGYRINEAFWNQGIATNAVELMIAYLSKEIGIGIIQAFVMPDNIYSSKVLLKNGFQKEGYIVQEKNWGGQEVVDVDVYTYISK
ncbi:GNAT family protein [Sedimentibacter sp.]|uniref:GNAT family N-acetyltransferase n=1 Tax=Sedimentibacter sp. TaxID=1960295 RepID=UPI0028AA8B34|nr:GNAT family protein [Sedimentibacter sp.]